VAGEQQRLDFGPVPLLSAMAASSLWLLLGAVAAPLPPPLSALTAGSGKTSSTFFPVPLWRRRRNLSGSTVATTASSPLVASADLSTVHRLVAGCQLLDARAEGADLAHNKPRGTPLKLLVFKENISCSPRPAPTLTYILALGDMT
jgi:hypothetical protein